MDRGTWLSEVEGLRGLAALWVFALHVSILTGTRFPVISWGALGVDLFIMISGFLMVHQYEHRKLKEPWNQASTMKNFWIRRFFRIAPLYYPVLLLSFALDPMLGSARLFIGTHFPQTLTEAVRYSDRSIPNLFSHLTFIFGMLPKYAFETPLPDWSIGLEAEYYAVFPLMMLLVLRFGYKKVLSSTVALCLISAFIFPAVYRSFGMPSFLPLKLALFTVGMLIAAELNSAVTSIIPFIIGLPIASFLALRSTSILSAIAQIIMALLLFGVTVGAHGRMGKVLQPIRYILRHRVSQRLGEFSYSLYLVHLLIVLPVCAFLLRHPWFAQLPPSLRFSVAFLLNALVVMPASAILYATFERPGVRLGKRVLAAQAAPIAEPRSATGFTG